MRWLRDPSGRVPERPHYDLAEIDGECESRVASFLRHRHGGVRYPLSTNDLTILLEQETSDLDLYADLAAEGTGSLSGNRAIEGVTEFVPGDKPRVRIARHLSEDPAREHRLRTTLAHELGHVWFHAFLWAGPPAGVINPAQNASRRSTDLGLRTSDRAPRPAVDAAKAPFCTPARPIGWNGRRDTPAALF